MNVLQSRQRSMTIATVSKLDAIDSSALRSRLSTKTVLTSLLLALYCFAFGGCNNYPQSACRCAQLDASNADEICLSYKSNGIVILGPFASLVHRINDEAVVVSNFITPAMRSDMQSSDGERLRKHWSGFTEGYFLHVCGSVPPLISLGMDREIAIAKAIATASPKDQSEAR